MLIVIANLILWIEEKNRRKKSMCVLLLPLLLTLADFSGKKNKKTQVCVGCGCCENENSIPCSNSLQQPDFGTGMAREFCSSSDNGSILIVEIKIFKCNTEGKTGLE